MGLTCSDACLYNLRKIHKENEGKLNIVWFQVLGNKNLCKPTQSCGGMKMLRQLWKYVPSNSSLQDKLLGKVTILSSPEK